MLEGERRPSRGKGEGQGVRKVASSVGEVGRSAQGAVVGVGVGVGHHMIYNFHLVLHCIALEVA